MTLRLACIVGNCIPTVEKTKAGCSVGGVAGGHTVLVPGMSAAGLCARFAPTLKWLLDGAHFDLHILQSNKMGIFLKQAWRIIFIKIH